MHALWQPHRTCAALDVALLGVVPAGGPIAIAHGAALLQQQRLHLDAIANRKALHLALCDEVLRAKRVSLRTPPGGIMPHSAQGPHTVLAVAMQDVPQPWQASAMTSDVQELKQPKELREADGKPNQLAKIFAEMAAVST